ncbi:MAG TPA: formate--tetrahydrofolate ligase [Candidatus Aminicenantes bacterium]|nr:formate--tetrahydrofolate ligase [Candidatus Aminicenantes bacterium]
MKTDIEIARSVELEPIESLRERLGILENEFSPCGRFKGKVDLSMLERLRSRPDAKLIVVTAVTPTRYGEGKTTTSIGLTMGLNRLGHSSIVTLREPSLGPVFGVKGGAAGGGYSQVLPMEDINLHFTGDIHAITTANNLLSAMIGNHMHFSNDLRLDTRRILWNRAMDMNDRSLRHIVVGLGGHKHGYPREDEVNITAASEVMAVLALSENVFDLKERLRRILVGFARDGGPVFVRDFKICGAMAAILRDAIKPNLVQTMERTAALIHCGPFANISFGTNSVLANRMALKMADYVVTECGFGSDLGFEKFVNLVSRTAGYSIHAVVVVATVRALRHQGGDKDVASLRTGLANLGHHIANVRAFGLAPVVAVNAFPDDTPEELETILSYAREQGAGAAVSTAHAEGGAGAEEMAAAVVEAASSADGSYNFIYDLEDSVEDKIEAITRRIYGGAGVIFEREAKNRLKEIRTLGMDKLPVCIAKTPLSLSDNKRKRNVPEGWRLNVRDINIAAGGGYLIPVAGDIMLMPGLPEHPAAEEIDIDETGKEISGLF